jgi:hypothetical protein
VPALFYEDARLKPFADQADDALVADAVFQEAEHPVLADASEEVANVGVVVPGFLALMPRSPTST